jgi:hypothetical protein
MTTVLLLLLFPVAVVGRVISTHRIMDPRISEASAAAPSQSHRGRLWTLNDSGGDPVLFLTDSSGAALGTFTVAGARNRDWESLGLGRCGSRSCLYIGDTGDNSEQRRSITIYRVAEPEDLTLARTRAAEQIQVEYPDGAHDVEGLYVEPEGGVVLITKGRSKGVLTFRIPPEAWRRPGITLATRLDSLPIPASLIRGNLVTDAAISPDGLRVVIRTYTELWFFLRDRAGRLRLDPARPTCAIPARTERQGEGVGFWGGDTLVLTSELGVGWKGGTITLLTCPAP